MSTSLYLVFGEDEFLVASKAKEIVEDLVPPENQALGLEVIEAKAESADGASQAVWRCVEGLQTVGLLADQKVVWLRGANFLSDTQIGRTQVVKTSLEALTKLVAAGLPPGEVLLVTADKVDKRYGFFKACQKAGEVLEFGVSAKAFENENQAREHARQVFASHDLRAGQDVMAAFLGRVGTDTRQIVNETEKLAVFLGKPGEVSADDVRAVTSASRAAVAWDLEDAFGSRDLGRALEILRQLMFQKESPIRLVVGLQNRIRELTVYREAIDRGWLKRRKGSRGDSVVWGDVPPDVETAFAEAYARDPRRTHPYRVGLLARQANRFSKAELGKCREASVGAHMKLVSSSLPAGTVLELLLIETLC